MTLRAADGRGSSESVQRFDVDSLHPPHRESPPGGRAATATTAT
jgi:hypothetical protein